MSSFMFGIATHREERMKGWSWWLGCLHL